MGRSPCCDKVGLKKGPWTPEEDQKLLAYIEEHGHGSWRSLPLKAGLQRCGKSCRLRWTNYLRPDIKRGKFSLQEEQTIIQLHALLGNRWSAIATHLPKRTDNEIKNYWNTHLKKRLTKMGIDPVTHKPRNDTLASGNGHSRIAANLSHMAQWESARLEAEARLARESKLRSTSQSFMQPSTPPPARPAPPLCQQQLSINPATPPCLDVLRAWQDMAGGVGGLEKNEKLGMGDQGVVEGEEMEWKFVHNAGMFAAGFTGMLLDESDERNAAAAVAEGCGESENAGGRSFSEGPPSCVEEEEEENKDYWNTILDLVEYSSSPSNSPRVF